MNLERFEFLMGTFRRKELGQDPDEWRCFLEFVSSYFASRRVSRPIVVEIGIWNGVQRRFYEEILGAEHIGIDNERPFAPLTINAVPDIVGDSHSPETAEKLKIRLHGRPIDLVFIDGDHSYESVKRDHELYGSLTRYIVAFHDIFKINPQDPGLGVHRFWNEIVENERMLPLITFKRDCSVDWVFQMGIGCIIKGGG